MKKEYVSPVCEVIRFDAEDVITTSAVEFEFDGDDLDMDEF